MRIAYLNKKFIPLDKAKVPMLDRGLLYGDGVFETLRSYNGIIFRLEEHLNRLFNSLKALHIKPNFTKKEIRKALYSLLKINELKNAYIKIFVTRGVIKWQPDKALLGLTKTTKPTVGIYIFPYINSKKRHYKNDIKVTVSNSRINEKSDIIGHKTLNYLDNILARYEAKKKGFDDAIFLNTKGFISEATSSNIFIVKGKNLITPSLTVGALPGIMRSEVINIAKKVMKYKVKETFIRKNTLYNADEIFITNSLSEVIPVSKVGNKTIGNGRVGIMTKAIAECLKNTIENYCTRKEGNGK